MIGQIKKRKIALPVSFFGSQRSLFKKKMGLFWVSFFKTVRSLQELVAVVLQSRGQNVILVERDCLHRETMDFLSLSTALHGFQNNLSEKEQ